MIPGSPADHAGFQVDDQLEYWEDTKINGLTAWKNKVCVDKGQGTCWARGPCSSGNAAKHPRLQHAAALVFRERRVGVLQHSAARDFDPDRDR